jgi:hypothetical protein
MPLPGTSVALSELLRRGENDWMGAMSILTARSALLWSALVTLFLSPGLVVADGEHRGHHGAGHAQWHETFYKDLKIPGSKTSCCNLSDCRPTEIRSNGDHYEIMKDGRWIRVEPGKIVKVTAPDGGAHICAPDSTSGRFDPDYVFCIVMPLES